MPPYYHTYATIASIIFNFYDFLFLDVFQRQKTDKNKLLLYAAINPGRDPARLPIGSAGNIFCTLPEVLEKKNSLFSGSRKQSGSNPGKIPEAIPEARPRPSLFQARSQAVTLTYFCQSC